MIKFVNAKINLGLDIIRKRADGYHELETLFYPVGLHNGTPPNPEHFCDILEIHEAQENTEDFSFAGNPIDCPLDRNLIFKAVRMFKEGFPSFGVSVSLAKYIPDGAGLGGGSADASFTLMALNEICGQALSKERMIEMAARLGADCPFFIENRPVLASGIGEIMHPFSLDLSGYWAVIVKPDIYVSTKEAFAGITPREPSRRIAEILRYPIERWEEEGLKNDFEPHIFKLHPRLAEIKERLQESGALYAAMSGSGSSIFGIFPTGNAAQFASAALRDCGLTFLILL